MNYFFTLGVLLVGSIVASSCIFRRDQVCWKRCFIALLALESLTSKEQINTSPLTAYGSVLYLLCPAAENLLPVAGMGEEATGEKRASVGQFLVCAFYG